MSEKSEGSASEGTDPFAASLALSGAGREKADAFLDDQRHHIHEQLKQIHLDIFEKWLGLLLRLATLCVGIAAATGITLMVRDAAQSNGLIVEPFSVPPDLASRGLTGQAVASQMLDKLTEMQNRTQSLRPPQSYTNNWGKDLKVEIPETGISVGEFQRFLREWLGHDTRITGEVWRTADGIAIAARAGGDSGEIVKGTEADLGNLIQKAAENVYRVTQPYRYANYLDRFYQDVGPIPENAKARLDQAEAIYKRLTYDPSPVERAWAWNGLGTQAWSARGDVAAANGYYRKSLQDQPDFFVALSALTQWTWSYGHWEEALNVERRYQKAAPNSALRQILLARYTGDFAEMAQLASAAMTTARTPAGLDVNREYYSIALAQLHEAARARSLNTSPLAPSPFARTMFARQWIFILAGMEDWQGLITGEPEAERVVRDAGLGWDTNTEFGRIMRPELALAKAHLGDVAGAQALIAASPPDCDPCNIVRGQIAAMAGQPADAWFARAVHDAPSYPFAYYEWGRVLLARGQADAAIEKFKLANAKGPHFADPLEMWGEALMAKNQSHLALAKFAQAEKYAPNWGRLHLKWGEALIYVGKPAEAKAQFARAAALDLTPSEKAALAKEKI